MRLSRARGGLPVGAYVATLLAAAVGFMALSILDQKDLFFTAWGFTTAPAPAPVAVADGSAAKAAVRQLNSALETAQTRGDSSALDSVPLSPALRGELLDAVSRGGGSDLALAEFEILRLEPRPLSGWEVTTDETWKSAGSRSRLRFRYRLSQSDRVLRIDEMTPLLPEPVSAKSR